MTTTAIFCFVAIVLAASLRAFGPRRPIADLRRRARRPGDGLVLGGPVPTLDLVGGERRAGSVGAFAGILRSAPRHRAGGRNGD